MIVGQGGVTSPQGFIACGVHCGFRKNRTKRDLMLLKAEKRCNAAAVYTKNLVQGAPIAVTKAHLADGMAQGVICNSVFANTCNADGVEKAQMMCEIGAQAAGVAVEDMIVASTGVIGQSLPIEPAQNALEALRNGLSKEGGTDAAEAIMTTDTVKKEYAVEFQLDGKTCRIGGMSKGSGMIHPNMATMLCFLTTDAAITSSMLDQALHTAVQESFNRMSVDGDTSTNDMACIMASGLCGNGCIEGPGKDYDVFVEALTALCVTLAKAMAKDGEGATKLIECSVHGAATPEYADAIAKSIICSSLVKTAMFGADANWGRVLCAIGYAGIPTDITKVAVSFRSAAGELTVCRDGAGIPFSEELAKQVLSQDEVMIDVTLGDGNSSGMAWGCDLTYDYVKINGDYRT